MADLKTEFTGLAKTIAAIAASFGSVWYVAEPIVEDYFHGVIEKFHEEDIKEIKKLRLDLDNDYDYNKEKRNNIIKELKYLHPQTVLNYE